MKKLIILAGAFAALAGCRSASTSVSMAGAPPTPASGRATSGPLLGAPDARSAVTAFLAATETQDLQALANVWGGPTGSARESIPRDTLEMRELIMMRYLKHDKYSILSDAPSTNGMRVFAVQFTCGTVTQSTNFDVVPGPSGRWYVEQIPQMEALGNLCRKSGTEQRVQQRAGS